MTNTSNDNDIEALVPPYKDGVTAVIAKNRLHLLGGVLDNSKSTDTVYSTSVGRNNKLSSWAEQKYLPVTTYRPQALVTKTESTSSVA